MARIGFSLSSEEHGPADLARYTAAAKQHGFDDVWVSDHFHPWVDSQGQSPFVWTALGAMAAAAPGVRLGTGVTCPTIRIHPAIIAQAAATTAVLTEGRFFLGIGSGEALNEHILGDKWPPVSTRLEMLEEAVEVMRLLWQGGLQSHEGKHYKVENARLYTLPDEPPPVYVSAFGPEACSLAAKIGDGLVTTSPDADVIEQYRKEGGKGPVLGAAKVCWGRDEKAARRLVHELWPNSGLTGQLAQELHLPLHFEQACELVDEDAAVGPSPCGPDPDVHADALRTYVDAGIDEIYVQQIGPDQVEAMRFYRDEVLPRL
jgi:G6PDH family F420-dependent oxidoreductase